MCVGQAAGPSLEELDLETELGLGAVLAHGGVNDWGEVPSDWLVRELEGVRGKKNR